jgi:hypothetical protein
MRHVMKSSCILYTYTQFITLLHSEILVKTPQLMTLNTETAMLEPNPTPCQWHSQSDMDITTYAARDTLRRTLLCSFHNC